jgi:hypothetical protein
LLTLALLALTLLALLILLALSLLALALLTLLALALLALPLLTLPLLTLLILVLLTLLALTLLPLALLTLALLTLALLTLALLTLALLVLTVDHRGLFDAEAIGDLLFDDDVVQHEVVGGVGHQDLIFVAVAHADFGGCIHAQFQKVIGAWNGEGLRSHGAGGGAGLCRSAIRGGLPSRSGALGGAGTGLPRRSLSGLTGRGLPCGGLTILCQG